MPTRISDISQERAAFHFPFELPPERIAKVPTERRDAAKLMVWDRSTRQLSHKHVENILDFFHSGDVLVFNGVRVDPMLLTWRYHDKNEELLLLNLVKDSDGSSIWEAVVSGRKLQLQTPYALSDDVYFSVQRKRQEDAPAQVMLNISEADVRAYCRKHGRVPLPPYIRRARRNSGLQEWMDEDNHRYQTVFAQQQGAVAAPTAGLHFTADLLENLERKGVELDYLQLVVGWGTFGSFTQQQWDQKKLHAERVSVSPQTAQHILKAKQEDRRVIAVGTTSVRAIEWWWLQGASPEGYEGLCDLFLQPPWYSEILSGMITNFHLPDSSLVALVAGFLGESGTEDLLHLYREALAQNYRFYSYGDAMMVL